MTSQRRLARILAYQTLFELESRPGAHVDTVFQQREAGLYEETGEQLRRGMEDFASRLVAGTLRERPEIDDIIFQAAPAFPVAQLAVTDRVALEMAIHEMMSERSTPLRVVINEAVDLAKTYGGESSGRFVNGVLGTIAESLPRSGSRAPIGEHQNEEGGP